MEGLMIIDLLTIVTVEGIDFRSEIFDFVVEAEYKVKRWRG